MPKEASPNPQASPGSGLLMDSSGRIWDGQEWRNSDQRANALYDAGKNAYDVTTSYHRKMAFKLAENVLYLFEKVPLDHLAMLTVTFVENLQDPKEVNRRFNILNTNCLRLLFGRWVCVTEFQKRGAAHFHLLIELPGDIRTGFDFEAYATYQKEWDSKRGNTISRQNDLCQAAHNAYTSSASSLLKTCWAQLRKAAKLYGFGRTSLEPIKTKKEAVGLYLAKYIQKGCALKPPTWKRYRIVRYSRNWAAVRGQFAWNSPAAQTWREKIRSVGEILNQREDSIAITYGPRWAWLLLQIVQEDPAVSATELAKALEATRTIY